MRRSDILPRSRRPGSHTLSRVDRRSNPSDRPFGGQPIDAKNRGGGLRSEARRRSGRPWGRIVRSSRLRAGRLRVGGPSRSPPARPDCRRPCGSRIRSRGTAGARTNLRDARPITDRRQDRVRSLRPTCGPDPRLENALRHRRSLSADRRPLPIRRRTMCR